MKTSLDFAAPADLSLGRIRISGNRGVIKEWIATPESRNYNDANIEPGFYTAEITPVGGRARSIVFEVSEGIANTVALPEYSAISTLGTGITFHDIDDVRHAVGELYGQIKIDIAATAVSPRDKAAERTDPKQDNTLAIPTRKLSIGLAQEGPGRESWKQFPGKAVVKREGGRLLIEVAEGESWRLGIGQRVRMSMALEGVRIERLLLPMFQGGTQISVNPLTQNTGDIELRILPVDPRLRAIWRALDAGTREEAATVRNELIGKQPGRPIDLALSQDPWEAMMAALLVIRFPEEFGPIDPSWAKDLCAKYPWAYDVHVIRVRQLLLAASKAADDRHRRASEAVDLLARAQSRGSPYFSMSNQLLGEMVEALCAISSLSASHRARANRVRLRWLRERPLQAGQGVSFSWLSRDQAAMKAQAILAPGEPGLLIPFRNPRGTLRNRDTAIIFEGQLSEGQISVGATTTRLPKQVSEKSSYAREGTDPSALAPSNLAPDRNACPALSREPGPVDDPNEGRFGMTSEANGFRLSASFAAHINPHWVTVSLVIDAINAKPSLGDNAWFCLHPTFDPQWVKVMFRGSRASLDVQAWGGFTVGVWLPKQQVELELNLAKVDDAPKIIQTL